MLLDLTVEAQVLADTMSSVSEAAWCAGWIVFHEPSGRAFVPLSEWTPIFAEHEAERGRVGADI
jgi:hypothetical protein